VVTSDPYLKKIGIQIRGNSHLGKRFGANGGGGGAKGHSHPYGCVQCAKFLGLRGMKGGVSKKYNL